MFPSFASREALFLDRSDAGRQLASRLQAHAHQPDTIVFALPRGGVAVACEVARALALPFDVLNVRKLGVPGHEELAMGAIASGGAIYLDRALIAHLGIPEALVSQTLHYAQQEIVRREKLYRGGRPMPDLRGKTVLLVDDGIATGATVRAAVQSLRQLGADCIIVAAPIAAASTCSGLRHVADEVVCVAEPRDLFSIGEWYADFPQLEDEQVLDSLAQPAVSL